MEFYHVLNRGVDKRNIFLDDKDRARFIHDLFEFNDVQNATATGYYLRNFDVRRRNHSRELLVYIHMFCLMPNHYHLLLSPAVDNGISLFMKKLNGGYAKYFNERYERDGTLFQGKYKGVHISRDAHFLYIPFYIHFNPLDLEFPEWRERKLKNKTETRAYLESYRWSSHLDYLGKNNFPSVSQRDFFSDFFGGTSGYRKQVDTMINAFSFEELGGVMLE